MIYCREHAEFLKSLKRCCNKDSDMYNGCCNKDNKRVYVVDAVASTVICAVPAIARSYTVTATARTVVETKSNSCCD